MEEKIKCIICSFAINKVSLVTVADQNLPIRNGDTSWQHTFNLHLQGWHVFYPSISWHMQWFRFLINGLPLCLQVPTKIYIAEVYQVLLSVGEEIYIQFNLLYRTHCWPVTSFCFWREGGGVLSRAGFSTVNRKDRVWSDCIFYFQSLLILLGEGQRRMKRLIRHGLGRWLECNVVLQSFPGPCHRAHPACSSPRSQRISWVFQFWAGRIRRFLLGRGEIRGWVFLQLQYPLVYWERQNKETRVRHSVFLNGLEIQRWVLAPQPALGTALKSNFCAQECLICAHRHLGGKNGCSVPSLPTSSEKFLS